MSNRKTEESSSVTLGVVAISYNEERDLQDFIDHLLPWVDEIVIIDDGSSDRTDEIAQNAGPQVNFIVSPRNDGEFFSHQRNKGIDASRCDWLLHMDIDERVPPEFAKEILAAIRNGNKDAYRYRRLNFFLHRPMKGGGWQNWNLAHLAKRNILQFSGMYHETCNIDSPPERIGQLREKMWHLNDESYKERMEKSVMYCQEQASVLMKKKVTVKWWHLIFMPLVEFAVKLVRKKGYRDGILGLLFAIHSAGAMFRACALVWDEQNGIPRQRVEQALKERWQQYERPNR